jgi:ubiquinol-cytochrome c reductase iron-sulfur subunit
VTADGAPARDTTREKRAERAVLLAFGVSAIAGISLLVLYALGGQTQLEGILLMLCLGGLGVGIVVWGQELVPAPIRIEKRSPLGTGAPAIDDLEESIAEEAGISRRKLLLLGLGGAVGALAAALAIPVLSLGPAPGRSLFVTSWRPGRRLGLPGGGPVTASSIPVDGVLTVFPDGDTSDPNAATLLIHVGPALAATAPAASPGSSPPPPADEFLALSKICTHAGCPVGLYRATQHTLICPCHQSEFDVLDGARPVNGPAVRPLPRLPIRLEADGTFTALGDFPEPVGPSFWDMGR